MRLWKRKWFVLSDYCLFYYKGESRQQPTRLTDNQFAAAERVDPSGRIVERYGISFGRPFLMQLSRSQSTTFNYRRRHSATAQPPAKLLNLTFDLKCGITSKKTLVLSTLVCFFFRYLTCSLFLFFSVEKKKHSNEMRC